MNRPEFIKNNFFKLQLFQEFKSVNLYELVSISEK